MSKYAAPPEVPADVIPAELRNEQVQNMIVELHDSFNDAMKPFKSSSLALFFTCTSKREASSAYITHKKAQGSLIKDKRHELDMVIQEQIKARGMPSDSWRDIKAGLDAWFNPQLEQLLVDIEVDTAMVKNHGSIDATEGQPYRSLYKMKVEDNRAIDSILKLL
mmetsp:Transcript_30977/g.68658  ORF Transcript_30977/g.68658 Transcript_30977/m.68658 type:complete len:164 (+) Transcript_30977:268-759(+)|eukprot:CAMPEP_0202917680 /NCGR_PEP_ID=MMETSP1392-20130828/71595_1 /ASSEMBLY_ACC=CAM_ASM_000868 /TAXON_ID=225041 /ORGANISM="Chlamydomonas chlamydogama, Strain SAG 11-48b" /LENGTH=163 /DNA_ID=CAMNT_0049610511 /DNA_START=195 /DNA_END=686 /DNA_ORIENTATION=+